MHKSSFQSKIFKNSYLNKKCTLKILNLGFYDSSGINYNYGKLREKTVISRYEYSERSNVDIIVSDICKGVKTEDKF